MNKLVLELCYDIRAKRLWPVAYGAVVASLPCHRAEERAPAAAATPGGDSGPRPADNAGKRSWWRTRARMAPPLGECSTRRTVSSRTRPVVGGTTRSRGSAEHSSTGVPPDGGAEAEHNSRGGNSGGGRQGGSSAARQRTKPQAPKGRSPYTVDVKLGQARPTSLMHHNVRRSTSCRTRTPAARLQGVHTAGTRRLLTDHELKDSGEGSAKPSGDNALPYMSSTRTRTPRTGPRSGPTARAPHTR